jgi:hypothetical protein
LCTALDVVSLKIVTIWMDFEMIARNMIDSAHDHRYPSLFKTPLNPAAPPTEWQH